MHANDAPLSPAARIAALQSARAQILAACHGLSHDTDLRVAADALQRAIDALERERTQTAERPDAPVAEGIAPRALRR